MDRIAIISDIHGNLAALEAALKDIEARGISHIYCLGDLAGKGPLSSECIDLCKARCEVIVRGNWDDGLSDIQPENDHVTWQQGRIGQARLEYMKALPNTHDFVMSGKRIRLLHASHISEHHRVHQNAEYDVHLEMFQNTPFTGEDAPLPDIVGYGDIHAAYMNQLYREHKTLFNAGSVGNPLDIPLASYVILNGNYSSEDTAPFSLEFVRLPYDIDLAVKQAHESGMPGAETYEIELRTSVYRGRQNAQRR